MPMTEEHTVTSTHPSNSLNPKNPAYRSPRVCSVSTLCTTVCISYCLSSLLVCQILPNWLIAVLKHKPLALACIFGNHNMKTELY